MNTKLAYPVDDGDKWLVEIKSSLALALESNSLSMVGIHVAKSLEAFVDLKYELTLEDRIWLIKTSCCICGISGLDVDIVDLFASTALQLMRRKGLLPNGCMVLDWLTLYEPLRKALFPRQKDRKFTIQGKLLESSVTLAERCSRFYSAETTHQVLEEMMPMLNPHSLPSFLTWLSLLSVFLPVHQPPPVPSHLTHPNGDHGFYWTHSLFTVWQLVVSVPACDSLLIELFARLAEAQVETPLACAFTDAQIQTVFTIGMRNLDLPVGSSSNSSNSSDSRQYSLNGSAKILQSTLNGRKAKVESFAKFVVFTIFPSSCSPSVSAKSLEYLEVLIQAIEGFFHPSNSGRWTQRICKFLQALALEMMKRIDIESKNISESSKFAITAEIRRRFVTVLRPVVYLALFGKDSSAVLSILHCLKYLAWIDPDAILPGLLARVYPALETVTETHRTVSCLSALNATFAPLLHYRHYPNGCDDLVSVLHLAIPGLDINDPTKTSTTLTFLLSVLMTVPLLDSTNIPPSTPLSDALEIRRLSTGGLESWVIKFFGRIFLTLDNLPQNHGIDSKSKTVESMVLDTLLFTSDVVFAQVSETMEELLLRKLVERVRDNVIPTATKAIGILCSFVSQTNTRKRLNAFIPLCIDRIREEIENGASSTHSGKLTANINPFGFSRMSDAALHWYQAVLNGVIRDSGDGVLEHVDALLGLLDDSFRMCQSRRGYSWAAKMLRYILGSLTAVYPMESKSHTQNVWNDAKFQQTAFIHWGDFVDMDSVDVMWHVPSEREVQVALQLLEKYLTLCSTEIVKIIDGASTDGGSSTEFCKWLVLLKNCLYGMACLVKPGKSWSHNDEHPDMSVYAYKYERVPLETGYCLTKEKHGYVWEYWTKRYDDVQSLLHRAYEYVAMHRSDDVEAISGVIKCMYVSVTRGVNERKINSLAGIINHLKPMYKYHEFQKVYPRKLQVMRLYLVHLSRCRRVVKQCSVTPSGTNVTQDLLHLSLHKYAVVRKKAQAALNKALIAYPALKFSLFYQTIETLSRSLELPQNDSESDLIKGCLYVLQSTSFTGLYLFHWKFGEMVKTVIIKAERQEKQSIQNRVYQLYSTSMMHQVPLALASPAMNDRVIECIKEYERLQGPPILASLISHHKSLETQRVTVSKECYSRLVTTLTTWLHQRTATNHWRYMAMASYFLEQILNVDEAVPTDLCEFAFRNVTNEHPTLRRQSIMLATRILVVLKSRASSNGGCHTTTFKKSVEYQQVGDVFDIPADADALFGGWDLMVFSDLLDEGWLVKPKKTFIYSGSHNQPLSFTDTSSPQVHAIISKYVMNPVFWEKLIGYMSLETSRTKDEFTDYIAHFYKRLFGMLEDAPLKLVDSILGKLIEKHTENGMQRAAAEVIGGIIRGAKHWDGAKQRSLWLWVIPHLQNAFHAATTESLGFWLDCIRFASMRRDPRRVLPLVRLVCDDKLDQWSASFFPETKKLFLMHSMMLSSSARLRNINTDLLVSYAASIRNPYQQVRDLLGTVINEALKMQWMPSIKSVDELLCDETSASQSLVVPFEASGKAGEIVEHMLKTMAEWRTRETDGDAQASLDYVNAAKTVLVWFSEGILSPCVFGIYPYLPMLVRELFEMQEESDSDLQGRCEVMARLYRDLQHSPEMLMRILTLLLNILESNKRWHIKMRVLPIVQVLFFRHLHLLQPETTERVMDVILTLLADQQVEVRHLASATLSGLIRCSERSIISRLVKRFRHDLAGNQVPRKRATQDALIKRHATVLGITAIINAFPYEVPEWMPQVLVDVSQCVSDPSPISGTVTKTFTDFRRTHQDNWEEDKQVFSADELSVLSDLLISPSYYA